MPARAGSRTDLFEDLARDVAIVERDLSSRELLLRLGTPTRDHDDVACACIRESAFDRCAAVELDLGRTRDPRRNLVSDRLLVLRPWIVGGHDRAVRELSGDTPHLPALTSIPVAARAEDDDQPPVVKRARRLEDVQQGIGRVRIVDDHDEGLTLLDRLEATGNAA